MGGNKRENEGWREKRKNVGIVRGRQDSRKGRRQGNREEERKRRCERRGMVEKKRKKKGKIFIGKRAQSGDRRIVLAPFKSIGYFFVKVE